MAERRGIGEPYSSHGLAHNTRVNQGEETAAAKNVPTMAKMMRKTMILTQRLFDSMTVPLFNVPSHHLVRITWSKGTLAVVFTDTHCHLTHAPTGARATIMQAHSAGTATLITVGTDLASSAECVQIAATNPGVFAVVGIHPNNAIEATDAVLDRIEDLATHPRVVGVGETGLDYFRQGAPPVRQEESFRSHIRIARDNDRTLVIHDREAHDDIVRVLSDEMPLPRVVFHCFSGDAGLVETCAEHGWYMSFAGNVTFTNATALQESAAKVPLELLLTETDSPYLTPHPHRGKPNSPSMVTVTTTFLADLLAMDVAQMAAQVGANAKQAFALPDGG